MIREVARARRSRAAVVLLAALAPSRATLAQEPVAEPLVAARAHFERGNALFKEGAWALALAELLESRRLRPTRNATRNAAVCLRQLGRHHEALDLYEALLREFPDVAVDLKDEAQRAIVELRARVGTIEIGGAEAGAAISIDGESRGEYPPIAPLRMAAGSHTVRLYKEGFEPFETRLDLAGGKTAHVEVVLRALVASGQLEINEQGGRALDVLVDGNLVGKTPWHGRAPVGEHVIVLRGAGDLGTPPVSMAAERGRTTVLTLAAEELDAAVRVEPAPVNAGVAVDGIPVGHGIWEGRLRAGAHVLEVAAPGFVPLKRGVSLERGRREVVAATLERDESSPFWKKPPRAPRFVAEAQVAIALVPTFGGDLVNGCIDPCKQALGAGGFVAVHAGYELGVGVGFGLSAGYLSATESLAGRATKITPVGLLADAVSADDRLTLRGGLVGVWLGFTAGERVRFHARLGAGALAGRMSDERGGTITTRTGGKATAPLGPLFETRTAVFVHVTPEARVAWPLGRRVELSAGLAIPILVAARRPTWDQAHPVRAGSDGYATFGADALASPVVVTVAPGMGARYDF